MKRLLIVTLLAGCANGPTNRESEITARWETVGATCKQVYQTTALDPIRSKVPVLQGLTIAQASLEMMADQSYATEAQRPAILAYDAAVLECAGLRIKLANEYYGSDYAAVESAAVSDSQQNRLALYQGKITWGQYTSRARAINDESRGMIAALDQRRRQMGIQQQSANAQTVGAAAAFMATQPVLQPVPAVTFRPLPQPLNCTSIRQGAYTNTSCR